MTDYLSGVETTASVPGMRVICRYLQATGPATAEQIASALRPPGPQDASRTILEASLSVASDLGLLARPKDKGGEWVLEPGVLTDADGTSADEFQAVVLRMVGAAAIKALDDHRAPSDVALGLTWLLLRDPLDPMNYEFAGRSEDLLDQAGMLQVIPQPTQWNAFRRWALELGIANRASSKLGARLLVSARRAVLAGAPQSKRAIPAHSFIDELLEKVPILGHPRLVAALPDSTRPDLAPRVSLAVRQALISLADEKILDLEPGEDATRPVPLTVGGETGRTVRSIRFPAKGGS